MNKLPCIGMLPDKSLCEKRAGKSGYCRDHDPTASRKLVEERKKELRKQAERDQRHEQRTEIFQQELKDMIAECRTLDDLRKLELKVIGALIDGTIEDPRLGSPIAQMLKHQEQLIMRGKGDGDDVKLHERDKAIELAKQMSPEQMLGLIGDLAHGMKQLVKEARVQLVEQPVITITAKELPDDT